MTTPTTCKDCGKLTPADHIHTCSPQVANTNDADRAEFENYILSYWPEDAPIPRSHVLNRFPNGNYVNLEIAWKTWQAALLHARKNAATDGWKLVPIEPYPSQKIMGAAELSLISGRDCDATTDEIAATYRAMIAAAPALQSNGQ